jgi:GT2 family glycosyltransferase
MSEKGKLASVVISTCNRREALLVTLEALADQTVASDRYEVVVVDDGSTDGTSEALAGLELPYELLTMRFERNRGVSAGRNLGIRSARGRCLILLSDDLVVPDDFIAVHVELLRRHARSWVVGGFRQLGSLTLTPFGRYLDRLERAFDQARMGEQLEPHLWTMKWPTARNLSIPRSDLYRVGLFDERFRTTCEDQDLAHRAAEAGIRFLYSDAIECVHNDQAADLRRYCVFQERGAADTVLLCRKYPEIHGGAPIARENGPLSRYDRPGLAAKKVAKTALSHPRATRLIERMVARLEAVGAPDRLLSRIYRLLIGLHIFRGWRQALSPSAEVSPARSPRNM